jgi:hypothetical protein
MITIIVLLDGANINQILFSVIGASVVKNKPSNCTGKMPVLQPVKKGHDIIVPLMYLTQSYNLANVS